jgi:hypothetical protein
MGILSRSSLAQDMQKMGFDFDQIFIFFDWANKSMGLKAEYP